MDVNTPKSDTAPVGPLAGPGGIGGDASTSPMAADGHSGDSGRKKRARVHVLSATIDLETHIANYKDRGARIDRLMFIADRCPPLQADASALAITEIKQTSNAEKYLQAVTRLNEALYAQRKPMQPVDEKWVEETRQAVRAKTERLESELKSYRANSIKESIRMGYTDLGDHLFDAGDLSGALKHYTRTKDYCATQKHILDMCMRVIRTGISIGNFAHAHTFLVKAESIPDPPEREKLSSKIASIMGIINMESGAYRKAAKNFLSIQFAHADVIFETLSPNDIAVYGAITALASFERSELKSQVFENSDFKQFLELEPQIREMLYNFHALKFQACLEIMARIKNDLLLDIYLHEHLDTLFQLIRKKAIVQYFYPFMSVDMNKMAENLYCTVSELEHEVAALIREGQIQARIDSHNKILRVKRTNQRSQLYAKSLEMAADYAFQRRLTVLRGKLLERELVVSMARR